MSKNLVIVESPAKAKTIEKYLGSDFKVASSYGHISDLPSKELGVDVDNDFKPKYIISKDKRIGQSHMEVPGHDGKLGFGGPCFPKDCNALYLYSNELNEPMGLLHQVIETNNNIRKLITVQNINPNPGVTKSISIFF